MREFKDKIAVVTGAASGIGRAIADRCINEGMKVVLADIEEEALLRAEKQLKDMGAETLSVVTDISKEADIRALAQKTVQTFGAVHLLFNNAGVDAGTGCLLWENTVADWQWVINVNIWGILFATEIFVPIMLKQKTACHIVNTASIAGLLSGPGNGIYSASKHAVLSLSETLHQELRLIGSNVGVSVVCPGFVRTQIMDAERNRPTELSKQTGLGNLPPERQAINQLARKAVQNGILPEDVANQMFEGIKKGQLYIITEPKFKPAIRQHMENVLNESNPTPSQMQLVRNLL
ncbi:1-deoxy-11-beta-hydroxypentalenate dehydrogenase [Paenibacillus polymyxa E681]|uniref:SDR family NAD(P)-dependent oxidoreductase n=1 Tax=Paenibacillus polymyxa TaxID=1406 RepID=UPI0001E31C33|nr:SDR family NAD(P)-dependent oxidoreductase [Paenibacillus polymyxa]ADM70831.1 3-oxoacyl-ACP reductase [Paenibacillus polymyxa E681]QNV57853.1 1-deoxy-11-beta-hydroxypentalenate dehydrogenase [Paenibacillus polymyxa E681]QNV62690.1 1-deoxy-11-beta-hydroxypentalenate dehydrogenase [Paenibacillus polymyxa E681]